MQIDSSKAIACSQRRTRVLSVHVKGTVAIALSGVCANNMSLVRNGTGDYTLTPLLPFKQVPQVLLTPFTAQRVLSIGTVTANSIQILSKDLTNTAADAIFDAIILGSDTPDQI